jgi:hypothetical protein
MASRPRCRNARAKSGVIDAHASRRSAFSRPRTACSRRMLWQGDCSKEDAWSAAQQFSVCQNFRVRCVCSIPPDVPHMDALYLLISPGNNGSDGTEMDDYLPWVRFHDGASRQSFASVDSPIVREREETTQVRLPPNWEPA